MSSAISFSLDGFKILSSGNSLSIVVIVLSLSRFQAQVYLELVTLCLTLSQTSPGFYMSAVQVF